MTHTLQATEPTKQEERYMKLLERYSAAVNSDNLASNPRTIWSDSDVIGAAGLAGRHEPLGIALTRLFADGKAGPVVVILAEMAFKRARTLKVRLTQVEALDLAQGVLGWYRYGRCQPCGGTGYSVIPGTPVQGEECHHCHGTGRLDFDPQFPAETRELARWMSGEIDRSQSAAGRTALVMLAPRLEL